MNNLVLENAKAKLYNLYYEMELSRDAIKGLNYNEYRRLLARLTENERTKLPSKDMFDSIAGDDGIINLKQFEILINEYCNNSKNELHLW